MSEEWRRVQGFRGVSSLWVTVTSDAEIQIRSGDDVQTTRFLSANNTLHLRTLPPNCSVWLKSDDPTCQCQIQAEYTEAVTDVIREIDMRYAYGLMGLGIPPLMAAVSGVPLVYSFTPYDVARQQMREVADHARIREEERLKEQLKQEKPCPGITRLQAFKRELEEEKPKEKEVKKKK